MDVRGHFQAPLRPNAKLVLAAMVHVRVANLGDFGLVAVPPLPEGDDVILTVLLQSGLVADAVLDKEVARNGIDIARYAPAGE